MVNTTQVLRRAHTGTLKQLHQSLGCTVSTGTLSRVLNGKPVSRDAENAVRLALGLPPVFSRAPRTRREMTREQAARWDAMTVQERNQVLGIRD